MCNYLNIVIIIYIYEVQSLGTTDLNYQFLKMKLVIEYKFPRQPLQHIGYTTKYWLLNLLNITLNKFIYWPITKNNQINNQQIINDS